MGAFNNKPRNRCYYCDRLFGDVPFNSERPLKKTVDHIHPVSKGGRFHPLNIVMACHKCNSLKGNKTLEEFEQLIDEWIATGQQTKNGYTQDMLQTIKQKTKKLHALRSGYIVTVQQHKN